jgi:hypothetical protein
MGVGCKPKQFSYLRRHRIRVAAKYEFENWFVKYREAVLETDFREMPKRIATAKGAMISRREQLDLTGKDSDERRALHDALSALGVLDSEVT